MTVHVSATQAEPNHQKLQLWDPLGFGNSIPGKARDAACHGSPGEAAASPGRGQSCNAHPGNGRFSTGLSFSPKHLQGHPKSSSPKAAGQDGARLLPGAGPRHLHLLRTRAAFSTRPRGRASHAASGPGGGPAPPEQGRAGGRGLGGKLLPRSTLHHLYPPARYGNAARRGEGMSCGNTSHAAGGGRTSCYFDGAERTAQP